MSGVSRERFYSHELAHFLLDMPDLPVKIHAYDREILGSSTHNWLQEITAWPDYIWFDGEVPLGDI